MVRRKFSYNLKNILFITDICTSMSTSSTGPFFVSKFVCDLTRETGYESETPCLRGKREKEMILSFAFPPSFTRRLREWS